tara:strand:- start:1024 stop:2109 length:1086 start_codon:yes stop_codon:yes gene_type:complete
MLSRLLYFNDEVLYTFLDCLLKKKSLKETYFWICEYYYSEFIDEIWEYLFKIYYDFYAIYNPKLETFIVENYNKYQNDNSINYILNCVKTLYHSTPNPIVFCLRHMEYKITSIYVGRVPKWLKSLNIEEKKHINLIRSIKEFRWDNIDKLLLYLNKCSDWEKCYHDVIVYFNTIIDIKNNTTLTDIPYSNKKHILLATIIYCCIDVKNIKKIKKLYNFNNDIEVIHSFDETISIYKILKKYRKYYISQNIGCFSLYRYRSNMKPREILYNWDYYCYKTPIWNQRIKHYNGRQYSLKKTLKFTDDNMYDSFYNKYNYEPDEQDIETQEKSLITIEKTNIKYWLSSIFDNSIYYDSLPDTICY